MSVPTPTVNCYEVITVSPGGKSVIPGGATIINTDADDISVLSSSCPSIEAQLDEKPTICYIFRWEATGSGAPLDDAYFSELVVDNLSYTLVGTTSTTYYGTGPDLYTRISDMVPSVVAKPAAACNNSSQQSLYLKVPENFGVPKLKIENPAGGGNKTLWLIGEIDAECTCVQS